MKKLILTFVFAVAVTIASAQGIDFGIKAGPNFSILNYDPHNNAFQAGFNAGVFVDIGLRNWSLQPGVFFTTKGETINNVGILINNNPQGTVTSHVRLNYIQVPVNLLYHIKAGPLVSFYLGGGPYIAYGIGGTLTQGQESDHVSFNNGHNNFQPLTFKNPDAGVNVLAGLILAKKFTADVGYDFGLSDVGDGGADLRTRVVHISVGYLFK